MHSVPNITTSINLTIHYHPPITRMTLVEGTPAERIQHNGHVLPITANTLDCLKIGCDMTRPLVNITDHVRSFCVYDNEMQARTILKQMVDKTHEIASEDFTIRIICDSEGIVITSPSLLPNGKLVHFTLKYTPTERVTYCKIIEELKATRLGITVEILADQHNYRNCTSMTFSTHIMSIAKLNWNSEHIKFHYIWDGRLDLLGHVASYMRPYQLDLVNMDPTYDVFLVMDFSKLDMLVLEHCGTAGCNASLIRPMGCIPPLDPNLVYVVVQRAPFLRSLQINHCSLSTCPVIPKGNQHYFEHLDVSYNCIEELDSSLEQLKSLKCICASNNMLTEIPMLIQNIPSLETLDVSNNAINSVPNVFNGPNLKSVCLSGQRSPYIDRRWLPLLNLQFLLRIMKIEGVHPPIIANLEKTYKFVQDGYNGAGLLNANIASVRKFIHLTLTMGQDVTMAMVAYNSYGIFTT